MCYLLYRYSGRHRTCGVRMVLARLKRAVRSWRFCRQPVVLLSVLRHIRSHLEPGDSFCNRLSSSERLRACELLPSRTTTSGAFFRYILFNFDPTTHARSPHSSPEHPPCFRNLCLVPHYPQDVCIHGTSHTTDFSTIHYHASLTCEPQSPIRHVTSATQASEKPSR